MLASVVDVPMLISVPATVRSDEGRFETAKALGGWPTRSHYPAGERRLGLP